MKFENKDELKKNDFENRTWYHFDDIIRFWDRDINFSDIFLDKKLYKEKERKYFNLLHFI